jgi:hypothetical protein
MIRRMVAAQRPHCGLQPRQPYTWPAVRGAAAPETTVRTAWSLSTLHEQMIIEFSRGTRTRQTAIDRAAAREKQREKCSLKRF